MFRKPCQVDFRYGFEWSSKIIPCSLLVNINFIIHVIPVTQLRWVFCNNYEMIWLISSESH